MTNPKTKAPPEPPEPPRPTYQAGANIISGCTLNGCHSTESLEAIRMLASALEENAAACGELAKALKPAPGLAINGSNPPTNGTA